MKFKNPVAIGFGITLGAFICILFVVGAMTIVPLIFSRSDSNDVADQPVTPPQPRVAYSDYNAPVPIPQEPQYYEPSAVLIEAVEPVITSEIIDGVVSIKGKGNAQSEPLYEWNMPTTPYQSHVDYREPSTKVQRPVVEPLNQMPSLNTTRYAPSSTIRTRTRRAATPIVRTGPGLNMAGQR